MTGDGWRRSSLRVLVLHKHVSVSARRSWTLIYRQPPEAPGRPAKLGRAEAGRGGAREDDLLLVQVEAEHAVEELGDREALLGVALHIRLQDADLGAPEAAAVVEHALHARHRLEDGRQVVGALQVLRDLQQTRHRRQEQVGRQVSHQWTRRRRHCNLHVCKLSWLGLGAWTSVQTERSVDNEPCRAVGVTKARR